MGKWEALGRILVGPGYFAALYVITNRNLFVLHILLAQTLLFRWRSNVMDLLGCSYVVHTTKNGFRVSNCKIIVYSAGLIALSSALCELFASSTCGLCQLIPFSAARLLLEKKPMMDRFLSLVNHADSLYHVRKLDMDACHPNFKLQFRWVVTGRLVSGPNTNDNVGAIHEIASWHKLKLSWSAEWSILRKKLKSFQYVGGVDRSKLYVTGRC